MDIRLPQFEQQGIMYCYCEEVFEKYGVASTKILFEDNTKPC